MSTELYRPHRSILPYAAMITLTFGIMLLVFGGMIDGAARRPMGPILSSVMIPLGIGFVLFGGMLRKHAKQLKVLPPEPPKASSIGGTAGKGITAEKACSRCKVVSRAGSAYCRNCGQRLA